jgi:hypothetical protein
MEFTIHGPFEMIRNKTTTLIDRDRQAMKSFWEGVDKEVGGLSFGCGCYVFATRAGRGTTPWYVGMASRQPFENECFSSHKINIYNEVIASQKGTPILFLIVKRTNGGKFVKPSPNRQNDINYLETLLIGATIEKNTDLMNVQKTRFLKELIVPGLINTPRRKPFKSEHELNELLS